MPIAHQVELFPEFTAATETSLRASRSGNTPLTKRQKQFDRQVRKLEKLHAEYRRNEASWECFGHTFTREIHPAEQQQHLLRLDLIELFDKAWTENPYRNKQDKETLVHVLERECQSAFTFEPDIEERLPWFQQLVKRLSEQRKEATLAAHQSFYDDLTRLDSDEREEIGELMAEMLDQLGLDGSRFTADLTPEQFAEEMERQLSEAQAGRAGRSAEDTADSSSTSRPRKPTAKQKKAEAKAAEREKARHRTLSTIYKQLAKVIHPDLETDPARRAEKQRVMQELTAAHRQRDLHTLLRLELEWLENETGHLDTLSDEKLAIYLDVLREQIGEVEASIAALPGEPRFAALSRWSDPWKPLPRKASRIVFELTQSNEGLRLTIDSLQRKGGAKLLKKILHAKREQMERENTLFDLSMIL